MERPDWAPPEIDIDQPSIARVYDYFLGGFHNFDADRAIVEQTLRLVPEAQLLVQANRAFLTRAVQYCVEAGVTQFLDIGSGIPTVGNVHEIAQQINPKTRVVYVDNDPVAVSHSRAILADNDLAIVLQADLLQPEKILADPELLAMLDLSQPVALLIVSVLHFVPPSDNPEGVIDHFFRALAPGSYLVISHGNDEGTTKQQFDQFRQMYEKAVARTTLRTREEVSALFRGFELIEPGLVAMAQWRRDPTDQVSANHGYAGVGRKP